MAVVPVSNCGASTITVAAAFATLVIRNKTFVAAASVWVRVTVYLVGVAVKLTDVLVKGKIPPKSTIANKSEPVPETVNPAVHTAPTVDAIPLLSTREFATAAKLICLVPVIVADASLFQLADAKSSLLVRKLTRADSTGLLAAVA